MLALLSAAVMGVPADYRLPEPVEVAQPLRNGIEQRRIAFHVLNAADLGLTLYCLEAVDGCREQNPIYGQSKTRLVLGKVASAVIYELVLDHLRDSGDHNAVRWFQYGSIAITGGAVVWNLRVAL